MSCNGAFATTQQYADLFRCGTLTANEITRLEPVLAMTASNIHAVLAQVGACDCTFADWALVYLAKLNVIEAALLQQCGCGTVRLTTDQLDMYREMLKTEYDRILTGEIDVCQNSTGLNQPAVGVIQYGLTPFGKRQLVIDTIKRNS